MQRLHLGAPPIRNSRRIFQILIFAVACLFIFNMLPITHTNKQTVDTYSSMGSTGSEVRQIQSRLKSWGYYTGSVDGIYGAQTRDAISYFQSRNGLTVDGIAGPATLNAIGIASTSSSGGTGGSNNLNLLARLISAEARGEPYVGQVAVGAVVLNRVQHPSFPDTIAGVIYQPGAFSCVDDGQFDQPIAESAYRAARDALNGWDPVGGAIYYYNPSTATNWWIRNRPYITTIGKHVFCA